MTIIKRDDLIESVAAALQYISYYHPADYIAHLARAYELEQSPAAKDAIAQILTNSRMCAEGRRPICQDTGIVNVFMKIGMGVRFEGFTGSIVDAVNEGVRQGYNNPDNCSSARILRTTHRLWCTWSWYQAIPSTCKWQPKVADRKTSPNSSCSTHLTP
jgi:fumarate hydratase class I